MALSQEFIWSDTGSGIIIGKINVSNSEFETGKDHYTLRLKATNSNGSDEYVYRITSANGYLPSMIIGGEANASNPWGCPFSSSWGLLKAYFSTWSNMGGNFGVSLYSHTGNDTFTSYRAIGGGVIYGGEIAYDGTITIDIEADFPLFMGVPTIATSTATYIEYRPAQDNNLSTYCTEVSTNNDLTNVNKAINYYSVVNTIPVNHVYTVRCLLKKNGSAVSGTNKAYDFRIRPNARIWFVLTNRTFGDGSANMILHINESPWLQKNAYAPDSAYTETGTLDSTYWFGNWTDYDNGDSYTGVCSTNIPIFDSDAKGNAYGSGDIGIDEALNGGDTSFSRSTIGEDLNSSDIPTVNLAVSGCGSYIYALSDTELKEIMHDYLYTTDTTLQGHISDGLWMWGNNPAEFLVDLYYIPFAISNFYDTVSANLKFGTYQIPDTSYSAIKEANGDRITLFNTTFEGIYGDWRDYTQFDYDLFLPFVSFVSLDVQKYLNKTVRCEMMFDITTHNLRYYLFADDVLTDRFDGSVGVNMPIMATDIVNKAKSDREAYRQTKNLAMNIGTGVATGIAGVMSGNAFMSANSVSNITSALSSINEIGDKYAQKASSHIEGSFSSAMNIYDINYAYLRITERGLVIPDKINSLYGYPSYYMGVASSLSGYCEISDIRLTSFTGTVEELEALKNALKEGVIL